MGINMDANLLNMKVSDELCIGLFTRLDDESGIVELPARTWTLYYYDGGGEELGFETIEFGDGSALDVANRVSFLYRSGELNIPGGEEMEAAQMGFNFLNENLPHGWRDRDWNDLDIGERDKCVLGILFMDYDYGARILQELHGLSEDDHAQYGFVTDGLDGSKLAEEWLKLLKQ